MSHDDEIDALAERAGWVKGQIEYHLREKLESTLPDVYVRVGSRIKTKKSIRNKILKRKESGKPHYELKDITDIVGFRIVCHFQSDVQKVVRLLLEIIKENKVLSRLYEPGRLYTTLTPATPKLLAEMRALFQEYSHEFEDVAKESQYTSLHLVCVTTADGFPPIEFQVRNVFEDAWSSIEHATKYKGQSVPDSVKRHLTVLGTLIQGCVGYAEAIRADLFGDSQDSESIKAITEYPGDWSKLAPASKRFFEKIYRLRKEDRHLDIISEIQVSGAKLSEESKNEELVYVLEMEKALSLLKLNRSAEARTVYESIANRFPDKAIVSFRIAELHRLTGDYHAALAAIERTELLISQTSASDGDRKWLERHLPLKKAYLLWKTKGSDEAFAAIIGPFERLAKDDELQRSYFNAVVYHAVEASKKPEKQVLRGYMERMKREHMASTETARPEIVDTYAWLCFHGGDRSEALRAMNEVMQCIKPDNDGSSWFEHNRRRWLVPTHDLLAILRHAGVIFGSIPIPDRE